MRIPGVKRPRRGADHPPRSIAEVETVELYLYSPSGPILGWTLPLSLLFQWRFKSHAQPPPQYLDTTFTAVASVQAVNFIPSGCSAIGLHYGTGDRDIWFYINLIAGQQEYSSRQAGITAGIVMAVLVPILLGLVCIAYQLLVRRKRQDTYNVKDNPPVRQVQLQYLI